MLDLTTLRAQASAAVNRLAKWRTVFAGWQLGTRPATDPECQAVRDQRELLLILRAEVNALTRLFLEKKVFTEAEHLTALIYEIELAQKGLEARFPGFKATDTGITMQMPQAAETTKGWKP